MGTAQHGMSMYLSAQNIASQGRDESYEKASFVQGLNIYTSLCGAHARIATSYMYMFISESREGQWTWSVSCCCNEG